MDQTHVPGDKKLTEWHRVLSRAVIVLALLPGAASAQRLFANDPAAVFTEEQAARGKSVYSRTCVACHGAVLEGSQFGPALKGRDFESHWQGRTRAAFSQQIRTTMPPRGLGSVSGAAYTEIEAYVLQVNGVVPDARAASSAVAQAAGSPDLSPATPPDVSPNAPPITPQRGDTGPLHQAALDARAAKLATVSPVTDAMLRDPPLADWLIWRRTYNGHGYSPLASINSSNVKGLRQAWSWSLPQSMNEITPLVHDGVMFITAAPWCRRWMPPAARCCGSTCVCCRTNYDNGRRRG